MGLSTVTVNSASCCPLARTMPKFPTAAAKSSGVLHRPPRDKNQCIIRASILNDAVLVVLIQSISSTLLVGTASFLTINKRQYLSNHLSLWLPV